MGRGIITCFSSVCVNFLFLLLIRFGRRDKNEKKVKIFGVRPILVGGCYACLDVGRPTIITLSTQTGNLLRTDDELEDGPNEMMPNVST